MGLNLQINVDATFILPCAVATATWLNCGNYLEIFEQSFHCAHTKNRLFYLHFNSFSLISSAEIKNMDKNEHIMYELFNLIMYD